MQMGQLLLAAAILVSLVVSGRSSFDFYNLSLQCSVEENKKCIPDITNTFTIHGLWPDKFKGSKKTTPDFFYKLSLQWPPSVCSISQCGTTIPEIFTIHGLWPQYLNDTPVRRYDPVTNKCTDVVPTKPSDILVPLQPIKDKLEKLWPSILRSTTNEQFWKLEWERHATCSDFPDHPYGYFVAALCLVTIYNPLNGTGLVPRQEVYKGKAIRDAINATMGAFPEITCEKKDNKLKLTEIRLCFDRAKPPFVLRDCPKKYSNACNSDSDSDDILFPLS